MFYIGIVLCITFIYVADAHIVKSLLVSRKLCNNDPHDTLVQKCFNSQYSNEVSCDPRIIDSSNCTEIKYNLHSLSFEALEKVASVVDVDSSVRRITLNVAEVVNINFNGELIDRFLLPRPMWSVALEPFNSTGEVMYVLERYSQLWDPYFEFIAQKQFPNASVCLSSMMLVGYLDCVHPGFSDVRRWYFGEFYRNPVISAIYVPLVPVLGSAFISDEDCPLDHANRWTCAFMQMTNCSIPLTALHKDGDRAAILYNSTLDGGGHYKRVDRFNDALQEMRLEHAIAIKRISRLMANLPPFVYTSPFSHAANMFKFHGPDEHQVAEFLFMEFLFRKTALYRRKVAEVLAGFRAKYGLGDAIRTKDRRFVAVHIRRSDRMLKGVNMTEFCHNLLVQRETGVPQNCTYGDGTVGRCVGNENVYGCDKLDDIPVGSVTLDSVIMDAEQLIGLSIRNMIIFSEDIQWVEAEIRQARIKHPEWKFYSLDPPIYQPTQKDHGFDVRRGGTASGVFFHATIDLVQECDALLGHFNSGVPMTFAGAMCHHHAGMEGICPPVYNLKNKL